MIFLIPLFICGVKEIYILMIDQNFLLDNIMKGENIIEISTYFT